MIRKDYKDFQEKIMPLSQDGDFAIIYECNGFIYEFIF